MNYDFRPIRSLLKKLSAQENFSLAQLSTLKVGGPARYFVNPSTVDDICSLQSFCLEYGVPLHIVSGGSNTLFSDEGFFGIVLKLSPAFDFVDEKTTGEITAGSATSFAKLTKMAITKGFAPAVGWSGTPGLIGGALRMNAGTRAGEIKDAVLRVHGVKNGKPFSVEKRDIAFGYRHNNLPDDLIITHADLFYDAQFIEPVESLLEKAREYRQKRRATQPNNNSLGSFFKNPYPLFAAQLIEKCNLKGLNYKSAQISSLHANFIINNGGASASDILHIASTAQKAVFDKFGILLVPEVRMVGVSLPKLSVAQHSVENQPNTNLC